ncbi:autotransporter domain-containing protein [uncultured Roseibium sp.]|uniref:autotransporter outer membrane beta-barrel domain-containing protein n=1 Tax=uncultured Roseibium sp. TaxID=1936171 RepID=UPI0032175C20
MFFTTGPAWADDLLVGQSSPGEVHDVSGTETYDNFRIGYGTNEIGTVNVRNGAKLITGPGESSLGGLAGSDGTVTISGAGSTWTANGQVRDGYNYLGDAGTATLVIDDGGSLALNRGLFGVAGTGNTNVTVKDSGSSFQATGDIIIGYDGTARIDVSNGAAFKTNGVAIGGRPNTSDAGTGTLTVSGAGTRWTNRAGVDVGRGSGGTGTLTISDGATATMAGGVYGESGATVLIKGENTNVTIGDKADTSSTMWFSFTGGDITVSDGAYLYSDGGYIGGSTTALTTMKVSGPGTVWETTRRIFVGGDDGGAGGGNGVLTVSNGASVDSATIGAGLDTGSTGRIDITGAGTSVHAKAVPEEAFPGNFYVAYAGNGVVNLSDGAALTVDNELRIATAAGSTGTLNIGAAESDGPVAPGSITAPTVVFGDGTGTLVLNHTSENYTLSTNVTGNGTLKILSGTTHLTGDYSGYTGAVTIDGGALSLDTRGAVAGAFTVNSGGALTVTSAISGVSDAVSMNGATLDNSGSISGSRYGILLTTGGNTLTNSGTISGGTASVYYAAGGNSLAITPTASFGALVDFNNTTGNTTSFGAGSYSVPVARYLTADNAIELNNSRQTVVYGNPASASGTINVIDAGATVSSFATTQMITSSVSTVMTDILSVDVDRSGPVYSPNESGPALGYETAKPRTDGEQAIATLIGDGLAIDPYGNLIWMRAFGGQSFDDDTDTTAAHYGVALGADHIFGQTRLGVMGGYGRMSNRANDGSSKVSGDTFFGGLYARHAFDNRYFDASLVAGGMFSDANRRINTGTQMATGTFGGWFLSPEMALSQNYGLSKGWMFTPKGILRYTHGSFDGYTEEGSSQNISYDPRTTDALQAALELKVTRRHRFANGRTASVSLAGTVLDTYNMSDSSFNATLQNTSFTISTSDQRHVIGGKLGLNTEVTLNPRAALFANTNAGIYSDNSWDYSANVGFKFRF